MTDDLRGYTAILAVANICLKKIQASTGIKPMASTTPGQMLQPLSYETIHGRINCEF